MMARKKKAQSAAELLPELECVRKALRDLYDAVVSPVPEGIRGSLESDEERSKFIRDGVAWQNNVAHRFGRSTGKREDGRETYSDDSLLQTLTYWHHDDEFVAASDTEEYEEQAQQWPIRVPALFLGNPPVSIVLDRTRVTRDAEGKAVEGMRKIDVPDMPWPQNCLHVKLQVALAQRRALELISWTTDAIRRYEDLHYPRLRCKQVTHSAQLMIDYAGFRREQLLPPLPTSLLVELARKGVASETSSVKHDLIEKVPELDAFILVETGKRRRENRKTPSDKVRYHLHSAMHGRIEITGFEK
jgi:hypothetical protein